MEGDLALRGWPDTQKELAYVRKISNYLSYKCLTMSNQYLWEYR